MSFDKKNFLLDEQGLKRLVSEKIAESDNLDFKVEGYGGTDKNKIEACKDVASFANTGGPGYILIGVEERDSLAIAVPGITSPKIEEKRLRDAISERIEPRVDRIELRTISLANGRGVVVVEIPVCELNIYAVRVDKGRYEFCIRIDKKKVELSFSEIQYRLFADLNSLRFRRKFENIPKYEKVSVYPILSTSYNEFRIESTTEASVTLTKLSSGAPICIPYELIQTVYRDDTNDLWMIYLQYGYHLKLTNKKWKIEISKKFFQ